MKILKKTKKRKSIPDDLILVIIGIFVGVLFLWCNLGCVYTKLDYWILIGTALGLILGPMVYSTWVYNKNKKGNK